MDLRDDQSETPKVAWSQKEEGATQKRKIEDIISNANNQIRENWKNSQLNQSNAIWYTKKSSQLQSTLEKFRIQSPIQRNRNRRHLQSSPTHGK